MDIKNFTDFSYSVIKSPREGYALVQVLYKYKEQPLNHFVYVKEGKNVNYIEKAKNVIERELNAKKLPTRAPRARKGLKVALISTLAATSIAFAGLYTYKHLTSSEAGAQVIVNVDVVIEEIKALDIHSSLEEIQKAKEDFNNLSPEDQAKVPSEVKANIEKQEKLYNDDVTKLNAFIKQVNELEPTTVTSQKLVEVEQAQETIKLKVVMERKKDQPIAEKYIEIEKKITDLNVKYHEDVDGALNNLKLAILDSATCTSTDIAAYEAKITACQALVASGRHEGDLEIIAAITNASNNLATARSQYSADEKKFNNAMAEIESLVNVPAECSNDDITNAKKGMEEVNKLISERKEANWVNRAKAAQGKITDAEKFYNDDLKTLLKLQTICEDTALNLYSKVRLDALDDDIKSIYAPLAAEHNNDTEMSKIVNDAKLALQGANNKYQDDLDEINGYIANIESFLDEDTLTSKKINDAREEAQKIEDIGNKRDDEAILDIATTQSGIISIAEGTLESIAAQFNGLYNQFNTKIDGLAGGDICNEDDLQELSGYVAEAQEILVNHPEPSWEEKCGRMEDLLERAGTKRNDDYAISNEFFNMVNNLNETSSGWDTDIQPCLDYYNESVLPIYGARKVNDPDFARNVETDKATLDEVVNAYNQDLLTMNQLIENARKIIYEERSVITEDLFNSFMDTWNVITGEGGIYQTRADFQDIFGYDVDIISGDLAAMEEEFSGEKTAAQAVVGSLNELLAKVEPVTEEEINNVEDAYDALSYRAKALADAQCMDEHGGRTVLYILAELRENI